MMDNMLKQSNHVHHNKIKQCKECTDVDFKIIINEINKVEKTKEEHDKEERIKAKIMTIARFNRMLKNDKENHELLVKYKRICHDGKLP